MKKRPTLKLVVDDAPSSPYNPEKEEQERGNITPSKLVSTSAAVEAVSVPSSDTEADTIVNTLWQFYKIKITRADVLGFIAKINNKKNEVIRKIDENGASTQEKRRELYDLITDGAAAAAPISNKIARKMMIYKTGGFIIKFYFPYKVEHEPDTVRNVQINRIVDEITFQIYARELNKSCSFKSPAVQEYGRFYINNVKDGRTITGFERDYKYVGYCYFIVMDYMSSPALSQLAFSSTGCNSLSKKINKLDKCLVQHLLFHNDLNQSNILVRDYMGKNKLALIDYGEAGKKLSSAIAGTSVEPRRYSCNMLRRTQRAAMKHGSTRRRRRRTSRGSRGSSNSASETTSRKSPAI